MQFFVSKTFWVLKINKLCPERIYEELILTGTYSRKFDHPVYYAKTIKIAVLQNSKQEIWNFPRSLIVWRRPSIPLYPKFDL